MTEPKPCRHEYVRIYQRRLVDLARRLVVRRGYLPTGFKPTDFGHMGEGSFCFCAHCRVRLYPKRTNAEKASARLALAESKFIDQALADAQHLALVPNSLSDIDDPDDQMLEDADAETDALDIPESAELDPDQIIHVEELEPEAVDVQDVKIEQGTLPEDELLAEEDDEDS
jgi:hypothetical protein